MYPGLAGAFDLLKKNKDDDETKEDPIAKAEREFFEIIKKVKTNRHLESLSHSIKDLWD